MEDQTRRLLDLADDLITDMELDDPVRAARAETRRREADAALEELRRRLSGEQPH